jgi:DNA polymerase-3 subunit delta'
MTADFLPWQAPLWTSVVTRLQSGELPHALLITGPDGVGKRRFAAQLVRALLCERRGGDGHACGACHGCGLSKAGTHPDLWTVGPLEDSQVIKIDQIRELCAALTLASRQGGVKVAVIDPADRMNTAAANSLLKTLEEPTARTLLLLVTARPSRLPATVRSRCQVIHCEAPPRAVAVDWLRPRIGAENPALLLGLADGAPLAALDLANSGRLAARRACFDTLAQVAAGRADPVTVAAKWAKEDVPEILNWLTGWVMDLIRLKAAGESHLANRDLAPDLQQLGTRLDWSRLFDHLDRLQAAGTRLSTSANLQLLVEELLIPWVDATADKTSRAGRI